MTRLRWRLTQFVQAIGLPGWVGAVLLLACALAWWLAAAPLRDETVRLGESGAALERRLAVRATAAASQPASPQQQLAEFQHRFPGERGIAKSVARLQAVARRQGVQLDQAEFRFASEASEPLLRYTIVMPVKADYRALRRFTREALLALPGLAIEEVNVRRSDPKSALLETQLRFVLFVAKAG